MEYMKGTHQVCCWQPASCSTGLAAKVEMQSCASLSWQAHSDSAASSRTDRQDRGQDRDLGLRTRTRTRTKLTSALRSQINTVPVGDSTDWGSLGHGVREGASSVMTK